MYRGLGFRQLEFSLPLAEQIPEGKQAIVISTDNVRGVNGFVNPGDRVNMILTLDIEFDLIPVDGLAAFFTRHLAARAQQPATRVAALKSLSLEELAKHAAGMGIKSVELQQPAEWPKIKEFGLTCAISSSHGFTTGCANRDEHEECLATLRG